MTSVSQYIGGEAYQYGTPEYDEARAAQKAKVDERLAARDTDLTNRGYTMIGNKLPSGVANTYADPYGYTQNSPWTQSQYQEMVEESPKDTWTMYPRVQEMMEKAGNWGANQPRRFTPGGPSAGGGSRPGRGGMPMGGRGGMPGGGFRQNALNMPGGGGQPGGGWQNTNFGSNNNAPVQFGGGQQGGGGDMGALRQALAKSNWG